MAESVFPIPVYPSMESLDESSPLRKLYPETSYANGDYYPSPFGRTKYWIIGPEGGKRVVLIHGLSLPSVIFKDVAPVLAEHGFQILLYDTYGRGYSEAPKIAHEPTIYALQLASLLQYIGWTKINVIGFSMGGAIAAAFASTFPHLIDDGVALLAASAIMDNDIVGPLKKNASAISSLNKLAPPGSSSSCGSSGNQIRDLQAQYLPGFHEVLDSCIKNGCISGLQWGLETLGKSDKKFLIVHGTADQTVPYNDALKIHKLIPQAELFTVEGANHYLVMEAGTAEKVTAKLVKFFSA